MTSTRRFRRVLADLETDGLLHELTRVHCLAIRDLDTNEVLSFRKNSQEDTIEQGLAILAEADFIVNHNLIAFDIPAIEKVYPGFETRAKLRDTLILCRLLFPDIRDADFALQRKGQLEAKYIGSHSLAAWGQRLGEHKGDYGQRADAWHEWSQEMEDYCVQDLAVNHALWDHLTAKMARESTPDEAVVLEHRFADLAARIEKNGFCFDVDKATSLYDTLQDRKAKLAEDLNKLFRPWWKAKRWVERNGRSLAWREAATETPCKTLIYKDALRADRHEGCPFTPVELKTFNPGSRDQIADRLQRLYGWKPKEFTPTGKPKVSEDVLRDLAGTMDKEDGDTEFTEEEAEILEPEDVLYKNFVRAVPQAASLADYFLVQKRLGQLYDGKNGWLKLVRDGKVHGTMNTLGAVTRRVTHAKPNMSQCPAIRSEYGWEMRSLWHAPDGWVQFGTDLSGIEIRCFANVLAEYDGGAYGEIVVNGDVHSENQRIFDVPTRDNAKTTLYAILYGAGDFKVGSIVNQGADTGRRIKTNFMRGVPAYRTVTQKLTRMAERQGWIPALDLARLNVRSGHKALNTSLQSAGALVAKLWGVTVEEKLLDAGLKHGWDGDFVFILMAHDEYQLNVRAPGVNFAEYHNPTDYASWTVENQNVENAEELKKRIKKHKHKHYQDWILERSPEARFVAQCVKEAIKEVESHFEFRVPLDCEYIVGKNWAECH